MQQLLAESRERLGVGVAQLSGVRRRLQLVLLLLFCVACAAIAFLVGLAFVWAVLACLVNPDAYLLIATMALLIMCAFRLPRALLRTCTRLP